MTEESQAKSPEATWKEQRDAVSRRNAEAKKRALVDKESRAAVQARSTRDAVSREAQQLRDLNARISKRNARRGH